jgi:hypothetical protein
MEIIDTRGFESNLNMFLYSKNALGLSAWTYFIFIYKACGVGGFFGTEGPLIWRYNGANSKEGRKSRTPLFVA